MILSATGIRVGRRLLLAIGAVAVVAVVVGSVLLVSMVRHGFKARDEPSSIERTLARAMRRWSVPAAERARQNPLPVDAKLLAGARTHWADHCASCHANDGSGQTTIGKNLYPRAPDMRLPETQELTDGELFGIIENGIRLTGMPAWGGTAESADDTWQLVAFIRHLPSLSPEEIREMQRLNPKGPEERAEEREEEEFLNGESPVPPKRGGTDHHHSQGE